MTDFDFVLPGLQTDNFACIEENGNYRQNDLAEKVGTGILSLNNRLPVLAAMACTRCYWLPILIKSVQLIF